MDRISAERRSENMRRIRSKGMKPELRVRRLVHGMGYRYRLHYRSLPGRPDVVLPSLQCVILVHGCFWHHHQSRRCKISRLPKSNRNYWLPKLKATNERDKLTVRRLRSLGWAVLVIWECELGNEASLLVRLREFLDRSGSQSFRRE
ncbi:MAG: DNA mismatch endonuclease Vsr [Myxococcota bacterium]